MPRRPVKGRRGEILLRPVHANAGIRAEYRRRLQDLIDQMSEDVTKAIREAYADNPPAIAQDALPANIFVAAINRLRRTWLARFNAAAPRLAEWFATAVNDRATTTLRRILRDAGISVRFQVTRPVRDIMAASVGENVALIRTIPEQYLQRVQTQVLQSAMVGRDIGALTRELSTGYGITARRAAFIARDQNNKLTSAVNRARQEELGVKEAIWLHSGGGHEPRPTHVAFSGKRYDIAKGAYLETNGGQMGWTWPGFSINCRCTSRAVLPALTAD